MTGAGNDALPALTSLILIDHAEPSIGLPQLIQGFQLHFAAIVLHGEVRPPPAHSRLIASTALSNAEFGTDWKPLTGGAGGAYCGCVT